MAGKLKLRAPETNASGVSPLPVKTSQMRREGESYVLSTGQVFRKSQITPEYIYQLKKKNPYFKGTLIKQKNLIFRKSVTIEALDATGKRDDRVTEKLKTRFLSDGYNIWNAMRQAFDDVFCYGISVYNPVSEWRETLDGLEFFPVELRHLPCRTFQEVTNIAGSNKQTRSVEVHENHSALFSGIAFDKDAKKLRFYQTIDTETTEIKNVVYVKDPGAEDIGGEPLAFPIIPLIEMLKYVWKSNMQSVNRIGAPIAFIKITNPKDADQTNDGVSDEAYASKVLANWGKDTAFVLRDNMEIVFPSISEGNINNLIIDQLEKQIVDYFSPASSISGGGALFGGSNGPELDLVNAFINGIHDWLEFAFRPLVQEWLDVNRYDGYTAVVTIPEPEEDQTTTNIQKALAGATTQSLQKNEIRLLLGEEELDAEGLKKLKEEYSAPVSASPFGGSPFGASTGGPGGLSYRPGELTELQAGGVTMPSANSFRDDGVVRDYGGLDAGLFTESQTSRLARAVQEIEKAHNVILRAKVDVDDESVVRLVNIKANERGKRSGTIALQHFIGECKNIGFRKIKLIADSPGGVTDPERLVDWYKRNGFYITSQAPYTTMSLSLTHATMGGQEGRWITVRGSPVFIPEGKDVKTAIKEHFEKKKKPAEKKASITSKVSITKAKTVREAEKIGVETGFAKTVEYEVCRSTRLPDAINQQFGELAQETGLSLTRVHVYGVDDPNDGDDIAFFQVLNDRIGIREDLSMELLQSQRYQPGQVESIIERYEKRLQETTSPTLKKTLPRLISEAKQSIGCESLTYVGKGERITTLDHEWCHALVGRAMYPKGRDDPFIDKPRIERLNKLGERCREFAREKKYSAYAIFGENLSWVESQESIAEAYAYWKDGNDLPADIVAGLKDLERKP